MGCVYKVSNILQDTKGEELMTYVGKWKKLEGKTIKTVDIKGTHPLYEIHLEFTDKSKALIGSGSLQEKQKG